MNQQWHKTGENLELSLNLIDQSESHRLLKYSQMQRTCKKSEQVSGLIDYGLRKEEITDISQSDSVEDQDALKLMNMICGGYIQDDFATHLSYNDFLEKKEDFGVLENIYQSIQKKYRNKKIEQSKLKFRSMLLMVFLEENISKLSRVKVSQIFSRNKIVW